MSRTIRHVNFKEACNFWVEHLVHTGKDVDVGRWQGVPTEGKPDLLTRELMDVAFTVPMPTAIKHVGVEGLLDGLADEIQPNLPWADDHFAERVSRIPSNPGWAYKDWPWWHGQTEDTHAPLADEFTFTHTYQERFWPKLANGGVPNDWGPSTPHEGIRYPYGDLDDVVNQLLNWPYGRQAYLPIYFPEDTGTVHGGRVPCTIGYFFLFREGKLHMWYEIRSCDAVRHFRDDVYLAARLQLWVLQELRERELKHDYGSLIWDEAVPGDFHFHAYSFHVHKGDLHHIKS